MTQDAEKILGSVSLVGAGPGDPGLITARGLERLRCAAVVVYDALANPSLLDQAPDNAERIDVGKRAGVHKLSQDQTNALLAQKARLGGLVVRLKGGDPYLFGRGAEEAAYLAQQGIACEVVPGITAGIAAPAAAGIPVTHRGIASTVTFITGHEDPTKTESSVDYHAVAQLIRTGGTACLYMAVRTLENIRQELTRYGLDETTPVAVIQWGTLPRQRHVRCDLATAAKSVADAGLAAPAIIVIGEVAAIDEAGLDYFTRRPLFGRRIVITRTRHQSSRLRQMLDDLGAETLEAPTIDLVPPTSWEQADQAIRDLPSFDWLALTSTNGVDALADRLTHLKLDARHLGHGPQGQPVKVAAIGDATAAALRDRLAITADLVPTQFVAESLSDELIAQHNIAGKRFLLLRADIARPALPQRLTAAGAEVTEVTAYQTRIAGELPTTVIDALKDGSVDWITFTSSSTATNLITMLGDNRHWLENVNIASIGPITSKTLGELNITPTVEATTSNMAGLVDTIAQWESKRGT